MLGDESSGRMNGVGADVVAGVATTADDGSDVAVAVTATVAGGSGVLVPAGTADVVSTLGGSSVMANDNALAADCACRVSRTKGKAITLPTTISARPAKIARLAILSETCILRIIPKTLDFTGQAN